MQNPLMRMQQRLQEIKAELAGLNIEGTAGDGAIKIVVRGDMSFQSVQISNDLVCTENCELIENLIKEAAQDGVRQILILVKAKTDEMRQEFNLP